MQLQFNPDEVDAVCDQQTLKRLLIRMLKKEIPEGAHRSFSFQPAEVVAIRYQAIPNDDLLRVLISDLCEAARKQLQ